MFFSINQPMALPQISKALAFIEDEKAAEAIPILEELSTRYPLYLIPRILRARAYEAIGQPQKALAAWREARLLTPDRRLILEGIQRTTRQWLALREGALDLTDLDGDFTVATDIYDPADTDTENQPFDTAPGTTGGNFSESNRIGPEKLDDLIERLENGKLTPADDPDAYPDPLADEDDSELVSETLARIYKKQARYAEAARVYRMLAARHPDNADAYLKMSREMEAMLESPEEPGEDAEH